MALPRPTTFRQRLIAVGAATALGVTALQALPNAQAANPGGGTVKPGDRIASWNGENYATAATVDPELCPPGSADPADTACDHYTLKVPVDKSYWNTRDGGAEVTISWQDPNDDFDLYVYKGDDLVASSAQGGTTKETALVSEAAGTYEVRVLPFLVTNSGYQGTATFEARAADGEPPLSGPAEYHGTTFNDFDCPQSKLPCLPDQEPRNRRIDSPFPSLVLKSGPVGREAAEPTIAVDKKGRAFFAAATFDSDLAGLADTRLLRSRDDGSSWQDVTNEFAAQRDFPFTLDPYTYIEEQSGRLFDLDLYVGDAFLSFSDDGGRTYEENPIAGGGADSLVQDHQTLFAGKKPLGSPLKLTDPDFREILYYCYNQVTRSQCTRSVDGGRVFSGLGTTPPYPGVEPKEGGRFCGGLTGHVVTDREGRVLLPKGHCNRPYIARSNDAATTWTREPVSDRIDMPDDHASVASDAQNNLYYVWYDSKYRLPWLTVSTNHGRTWGDPIMIAPPGVQEVQFPVIAAGAEGNIAITFPSTTERDQGDLTRPWNYHVVTSVNALSDNPTFVSNISNPATDPVHRGDCPGRCGNMLDFLDVIVSPAADHSVWATVVDTCTRMDRCNSDPDAKGFDEDTGDDNRSNDRRGIYVKQISGPNIGW